MHKREDLLRPILLLLVAIALPLPPLPAQATIVTNTRAYCSIPGNFVDNPGVNGGTNGAEACELSGAGSFTNQFGDTVSYTATAKASARATGGPRRVGAETVAQASITGRQDSPQSVALATVQVRNEEFLKMQAVGPNGEPVLGGSMQVDLLASGSLTYSGSSLPLSSQGLLRLNFTALAGRQVLGTEDLGLLLGQANAVVSVPISATIPWTAGQGILVTLGVGARSELVLNKEANLTGTVSFGNSLDWLGVSNVRDANGNPVADFTLVDSGGVLWGSRAEELSQVPVPGSLLLLAAAFGPLVRRIRVRSGDNPTVAS